MRELLRSLYNQKPVIVVIEMEAKYGSLTSARVREQLEAVASRYEGWGLAQEMNEWGFPIPNTDTLHNYIFGNEPIEWNRIGAFQDVTMRLICEADLAQGPTHETGSTYLQGELVQEKPELPPPSWEKTADYLADSPRKSKACFHVYCSPANLGAVELMEELASALELKVQPSTKLSDLGKCNCFLVYLNRLTWTGGERSKVLANEVLEAMTLEVPLLLAHEMIGTGGQEVRHGCDFGLFFACGQGETPRELLQKGIYHKIAVPLKGSAWRKASMVMLAKDLISKVKEESDDLTMPKGSKSKPPAAKPAAHKTLAAKSVKIASLARMSKEAGVGDVAAEVVAAEEVVLEVATSTDEKT